MKLVHLDIKLATKIAVSEDIIKLLVCASWVFDASSTLAMYVVATLDDVKKDNIILVLQRKKCLQHIWKNFPDTCLPGVINVTSDDLPQGHRRFCWRLSVPSINQTMKWNRILSYKIGPRISTLMASLLILVRTRITISPRRFPARSNSLSTALSQ